MNLSRFSRSSRLRAFAARTRTRSERRVCARRRHAYARSRRSDTRVPGPVRKVLTTRTQAWDHLRDLLVRGLSSLTKSRDLVARLRRGRFTGDNSGGCSSRIANGVRLSSSCFHSSSSRSLRLFALAARASTKVRKPERAPECSAFRPSCVTATLAPRDESGVRTAERHAETDNARR